MKKGSNNKYVVATVLQKGDQKIGICIDDRLNQLPVQVTLNTLESFTNQMCELEDGDPKTVIVAGTVYALIQMLKKRVGDDNAYEMYGQIIGRIPKMQALCNKSKN